MDRGQLTELSAIALEVAREAAAQVFAAFRGDVVADEKGQADLVTAHDLASERLIRARLSERTPQIAIVGEEEGGIPAGPTWYCDPIDGTTNFVHGHPFFCVSIGLMDAGRPLLGAVVAPALGAQWRGVAGHFAERDGRPCRVSATSELGAALLATGFHPRGRHDRQLDNLPSFVHALPRVRGIRRCGSAALDLCLTADGTFDGYWERLLSPWDTAAGAAIALGAGALVTNLQGGPVDLSIGHLAVANPGLHPALLSLLSEVPPASS
ncbi:MAG: inositol monophosphatase [Myxococcales bacterium]|nr:inositol monophosphatase [Myxococcales bacterium]